MFKDKILRHFDLESMEKIYTTLSKVNLRNLDIKEFYYVIGGMDALFSIVGIQNGFSRLLGVDPGMSEEQVSNFVHRIIQEVLRDPSKIEEIEAQYGISPDGVFVEDSNDHYIDAEDLNEFTEDIDYERDFFESDAVSGDEES